MAVENGYTKKKFFFCKMDNSHFTSLGKYFKNKDKCKDKIKIRENPLVCIDFVFVMTPVPVFIY